MKYYSYHPVTGAHVGTDTAHESPAEPGIMLLPAYATWIQPPPVEEGSTAYWLDGTWVVKTITHEEIEVVVDGIQIVAAKKVTLLQEAADKNINIMAKSMGFASMVDAMSYLGEDSQKGYDAETCRAWRAEVNTRLATVMAWYSKPGNEDAPMPTSTQFGDLFETAPVVKRTWVDPVAEAEAAAKANLVKAIE